MAERLRERLSTAQRLLADPASGLASNPELGCFVQALELTLQLRHTLVDAKGALRKRLSLQERKKALVLWLLLSYLDASVPMLSSKCLRALERICASLPGDVRRAGGHPAGAAAGYHVISIACLLVLWDEGGGKDAAVHSHARDWLALMDAGSAANAALDVALADASPGVQLTGRQVVLTVLAVQARALVALGSSEGCSPAQRMEHLAAALACIRRLLAEDLLSVRHYTRLCSVLAEQGKLQELFQATNDWRQLAVQQQAWWQASEAAAMCFMALASGAAVATCSRSQLHELLQQCQDANARCRPWATSVLQRLMSDQYAEAKRTVEALEARFPGQELLPVGSLRAAGAAHLAPILLDMAAPSPAPTCAACGKREEQVGHLQRCAGCGATYYCSRACQAKHWKEGGHKQECKQLAAQRRGRA